MADPFQTTFRIHEQGVADVVSQMTLHGYRQMAAVPEGSPLMAGEFVVRQQRRLKPEAGLMPHDIEACIGGRRVVMKIFATTDAEHSSLWRAPGYLLEAVRLYPCFVAVVTGASTKRMREVFLTTHEVLRSYGQKPGHGVAALIHVSGLFDGSLQELIEAGGGIAAAQQE
jgi:hypothetical protein